MIVDLHCHSTHSDGALDVADLVKKAKNNGITLFALTDHDTVDGVAGAIEAAKKLQITCVAGIELSVNWKKKDIHIIGLNIQYESEVLAQAIAEQQQKRVQRAKQIAQLLTEQGVDDCWQKAKSIAKGNTITRPHFAKVLINEGLVKDFNAAFKKYLGRGRIAYVHTQWMTVEQAVTVIKQCGGHAVLAHPHRYGLTTTKLNELVSAFKDCGGDGLEVVSGLTTKAEISKLNELCHRYKLVASTGSDFHGEKMSNIDLGKQVALPASCKPVWKLWDN